MISINKVLIQGYVGSEPEVRKTAQGKEMINLSVCTQESSSAESKSQWHRVVVFKENLISPIKTYIKKGSRVFIEGKLKSRKYTDKQGRDNHITEISVTSLRDCLQFENKKEKEGGDMAYDDIPF